METIGMETIGMDTCGLIAHGVAATGGGVEGRTRPFRWWIRGKTAAGVANPSPDGAVKWSPNGADPQILPRQPASMPALRAADQGVADALESVLSNNTQSVYGAQWRLFTDWCDEVGLTPLPAQPLTVARYLAARAGDGASIATCAWPRPPSPRSMSGQVTIRPAGTLACTPVKRIWKTSDLQNGQIADWPAAGGDLRRVKMLLTCRLLGMPRRDTIEARPDAYVASRSVRPQ